MNKKLLDRLIFYRIANNVIHGNSTYRSVIYENPANYRQFKQFKTAFRCDVENDAAR